MRDVRIQRIDIMQLNTDETVNKEKRGRNDY